MPSAQRPVGKAAPQLLPLGSQEGRQGPRSFFEAHLPTANGFQKGKATATDKVTV
ncbi:MAG: hypothetical protein JNL00_06015, partial [Candidatus Accumulibacter sp.]|nr:hypothetical protein [Accumulibacter sp.]